MVCIHCGTETHVINSRLQKKTNRVWRRRRCLSCKAVFTTEETVNYRISCPVFDVSNGSFRPFERDKLWLSLYECLKHRKNPVADATGLTDTLTGKLPSVMMDGSLPKDDIQTIALVALNRFDKAAATAYQAFHQ